MLGNKKGDQQARAELLGELLAASGDRPYMLQHGSGRDGYHVVMVHVTDDEAAELAGQTGAAPVVIPIGKAKLMPLQLESELNAGQLESRVADLFLAD